MQKKGRMCDSHKNGRIPGVLYKFRPDCPECVRRYGHLPPEQRDHPGVDIRRLLSRVYYARAS